MNPPKPRPRGKTEKKPKKKPKPIVIKEKKVPDQKVVENLIIMQEQFYREMIDQFRDKGFEDEENSIPSQYSDNS